MRNSCCRVVVGGGSGRGASVRGAGLRALGFGPEAVGLEPEEGGLAPEEALFRDLLGDFFFCAIVRRPSASGPRHPSRHWSQAGQEVAASRARRVAIAPSRATSTAGRVQCAGLGAS